MSTDIDRIERMFTKASWLIGIVWTLGIGTGAFVFYTAYSTLFDVTEKVTVKVETIKNEAVKDIKDIKDKVEENLITRIDKKIDKKKIQEKVINKLSTKIENDLDQRIKETTKNIYASIDNLVDKLNKQHEDLKTYNTILSKVLVTQEIKQNLVSYLDVYSSKDTYFLRELTSGIIGIDLKFPNLSNKKYFKGKLSLKLFGQSYEEKIKVLGNKNFKTSIHFRIPDMVGNIPISKGTYNYMVELTSNEGKTILNQESGSFQLY